jgi:hypothetical protein
MSHDSLPVPSPSNDSLHSLSSPYSPAAHHPASYCITSADPRGGPLLRARHRDHLTEQQVAAVELLLQGLTEVEVAARLHVNRTSIYRWRTRSPLFRAFLDQQRRAVYDQSAERIRGAMLPAIELLEQQVRDAATSPDRAIRAAGMLLKLAAARGLATPPAPEPPHPRHPPRPTPGRRRWTAAEDEAWVNAILEYAGDRVGLPSADGADPLDEEPEPHDVDDGGGDDDAPDGA